MGLEGVLKKGEGWSKRVLGSSAVRSQTKEGTGQGGMGWGAAKLRQEHSQLRYRLPAAKRKSARQAVLARPGQGRLPHNDQ